MSSREMNAGLFAGLVADTGFTNFKDIPLNRDLFNKMAYGACFNQCSQTDIDLVFKEEMECTYKCVITYRQAYGIIKDVDAERKV